jgi:hypothetical protein
MTRERICRTPSTKSSAAAAMLLLIVIGTGAAPRIGHAGVHAGVTPIVHAVIGTAETSITIEADTESPRVVALALRGAEIWLNQAAETLPDHVTVDAVDAPVHWHLERAASRFGSQEVQLLYAADSPRLRLLWLWRARSGRGPIEHTIRIQNLSDRPVTLPLLPSFRFDWQIDAQSALQRFWVEKGADTPSSEGTHEDALLDGDLWQGSSSTYARPIAGEPREMIPYLLVHGSDTDQRGWYLGIEFSGRTRITLERRGTSLRGEAGLNPAPGPYRTRLMPHETFEAPTIFLGASRGGPDGAGNTVRRWVRAVLNNPRTLRNPAYPLMVSNSWGSGMAVDAPLARRMIADARALGLEMFHLDAGWFRGVGDWHADPAKFPGGIAEIADDAHRRQMKFGLWVDWTQAGVSTQAGALNVFEPATRDWLIADPPADWKHSEPFKGVTIDLGVPAAQAWAARELERIVRENHLDMLEHDGYLVAQGSARAGHPAEAPDEPTLRITEDSGYVWVDASNATDVSYHATRAYYAIYEQLRRRHPSLLLEICNDGGRMVDFGSAAHGDYFSITDTYDPLSNRRAFYDASYVLPPAMLETYVASWPAPHLENLRYMIRSGMLGWFSLMLDASRWTLAQHDAARHEFALYKSRLRPLIREADLYHVADRPDGVHWDGIEYYSMARRRGVLYAFRGTVADEPAHRFRLQGLDPERRYRLAFEDRGAAAGVVLSGRTLMKEGLPVTLPEPLSSELVFITALP